MQKMKDYLKHLGRNWWISLRSLLHGACHFVHGVIDWKYTDHTNYGWFKKWHDKEVNQ